jgi:hypothetical protein
MSVDTLCKAGSPIALDLFALDLLALDLLALDLLALDLSDTINLM